MSGHLGRADAGPWCSDQVMEASVFQRGPIECRSLFIVHMRELLVSSSLTLERTPGTGLGVIGSTPYQGSPKRARSPSNSKGFGRQSLAPARSPVRFFRQASCD